MALASALCVLSACGAVERAGEEERGVPDTESATLPEVRAYEVAQGEPAPEVKGTAARFLETVFTYGVGEGTPQKTRKRLHAEEASDTAVDDALPLLAEDAASAAQVIYPQLGGLTEDQASIMAVVELHLLQEKPPRTPGLSSATRVIDLRLSRDEDEWQVSGIASLGGEPPDGGSTEDPGISDAAEDVLQSERIKLPDTARWDILTGEIDDRILQMMLALSAEHTISVAVLSTGHPTNVFDSSSVSNHIKGRAVDIWAIDGTTVSDLRDQGADNTARALMELALDNGATEVGGPWAFDTSGGATFTDTVHEDHLHIGFKQ